MKFKSTKSGKNRWSVYVASEEVDSISVRG